MTEALRYTPYASALKPFAIGLSAINPADWIEPDDDLPAYLDEKDRLLAEHREDVFQADDASRAAQAECLALLTDHLLARHGDRWVKTEAGVSVAGRDIPLLSDETPLVTAGRLVQDDLAILEKRNGAWTLTAGFVAFPSAWSLKEKAGLPMEGVHAHVPDYAGGTRNAMMLSRIFDNLQPDLPAMRLNWSIYPSGDLFWPPEKGARAERNTFTPAINFIRVERQTLRRLPETGAIVFTIRIYNDPISRLKSDPALATLSRALADKLGEFTQEQLAYKGMIGRRDAIIEYLRQDN
ncbi:heme-dependent oxidative N-demethylase family protein [Rhizobium sp. G21]|uniref:heme-dependent oxidative N-demethylase family protein n=1 Tax=Rhizobium sp. G21 TaxID=2758439 RepID=UPI0015FEE687|nr:DUF3445 domain-containing protein [Rhizobium sp. G21]MBB1249893.1 DUF3445 domain-containing protein [Rhizobium sp. G21]